MPQAPALQDDFKARWAPSPRLVRDLGFVLLLVVVLAVARYWRFGAFGLYEDDLTIVPPAVQMSPNELLRFIADYFVRLQGHARPLSNSLIYLLAWLGWRIGELRGIYLLGWAVVALNAALFYALIRRRYPPDVALAAGLAYVLYSADTTQAFLTHSLGLQPSITIVLLAFNAYLSGWRVLVYLLGALLLFSYETPYLLLAAAPLVAWGFTRRAAREAPLHLAILLALLVAVALLRSAIGEERVTDLSLPAAVATSAEHALLGPIVSLGSYLLRPVQLLRAGPAAGWIAALVALPFLVWTFWWIGRRGAGLEAADPRVDLGDPSGRGGGLLVDFAQRLADLGETRTAHRDLRQHRVERTALFLRRGNQGLDLVRVLLLGLAAPRQILQRIKHDRSPSTFGL